MGGAESKAESNHNDRSEFVWFKPEQVEATRKWNAFSLADRTRLVTSLLPVQTIKDSLSLSMQLVKTRESLEISRFIENLEEEAKLSLTISVDDLVDQQGSGDANLPFDYTPCSDHMPPPRQQCSSIGS